MGNDSDLAALILGSFIAGFIAGSFLMQIAMAMGMH